MKLISSLRRLKKMQNGDTVHTSEWQTRIGKFRLNKPSYKTEKTVAEFQPPFFFQRYSYKQLVLFNQSDSSIAIQR